MDPQTLMNTVLYIVGYGVISACTIGFGILVYREYKRDKRDTLKNRKKTLNF